MKSTEPEPENYINSIGFIDDSVRSLSNGLSSRVRTLVRAGLDVNHMFFGMYAPLHIVAPAGHLDIVEFLLSQGAAVDILDKWGNTPLHLAIRDRKVEIIRALVAAGADTTACDGSGRPAVSLARDQETRDALTKNVVVKTDKGRRS